MFSREFINEMNAIAEKPECTCREDSKQRALCPVCDKEEYESVTNAFNELKKVTVIKPVFSKHELRFIQNKL